MGGGVGGGVGGTLGDLGRHLLLARATTGATRPANSGLVGVCSQDLSEGECLQAAQVFQLGTAREPVRQDDGVGPGSIQGRLAEQASGLYDPKSFTPEMWTQLMSGQAPVMQGLMGSYLEQSQQLFQQMQEQMQKQAGNLFGGFPPPPAQK